MKGKLDANFAGAFQYAADRIHRTTSKASGGEKKCIQKPRRDWVGLVMCGASLLTNEMNPHLQGSTEVAFLSSSLPCLPDGLGRDVFCLAESFAGGSWWGPGGFLAGSWRGPKGVVLLGTTVPPRGVYRTAGADQCRSKPSRAISHSASISTRSAAPLCMARHLCAAVRLCSPRPRPRRARRGGTQRDLRRCFEGPAKGLVHSLCVRPVLLYTRFGALIRPRSANQVALRAGVAGRGVGSAGTRDEPGPSKKGPIRIKVSESRRFTSARPISACHAY